MLTSRFVHAVEFAITAHGAQRRKVSGVTYVAHLLAVASLVLDAGGDEDMAIAGLLHDAIEDTEVSAAEIETAFGPRVRDIVEGCTEDEPGPWRHRKERYIAHMRAPETPEEVLVVSRADKLHNARSMLQDYRDGFAGHFSAGPDEQCWYYETLAGIFRDRIPGPMTDQLCRAVEELKAHLAGS